MDTVQPSTSKLAVTVRLKNNAWMKRNRRENTCQPSSTAAEKRHVIHRCSLLHESVWCLSSTTMWTAAKYETNGSVCLRVVPNTSFHQLYFKHDAHTDKSANILSRTQTTTERLYHSTSDSRFHRHCVHYKLDYCYYYLITTLLYVELSLAKRYTIRLISVNVILHCGNEMVKIIHKRRQWQVQINLCEYH